MEGPFNDGIDCLLGQATSEERKNMKWTQLTFKQLNERKDHAKKNNNRARRSVKRAASHADSRVGAWNAAVEKVYKIQNKNSR